MNLHSSPPSYSGVFWYWGNNLTIHSFLQITIYQLLFTVYCLLFTVYCLLFTLFSSSDIQRTQGAAESESVYWSVLRSVLLSANSKWNQLFAALRTVLRKDKHRQQADVQEKEATRYNNTPSCIFALYNWEFYYQSHHQMLN